MFMFWVYTIAAIGLYVVSGYVMLTMTHRHMRELKRKICSIERGYVWGDTERIMDATTIYMYGSRKTRIWYAIGVVLWPILCMYLIVKAEFICGDIQKELWKRNELVR